MAVSYGLNTIVMTAASDVEGRDATGANFDHPLFINTIQVDTGNGGDFLLNEVSGARRVVKLDNLPADDTVEVHLNKFVRSLFVQTLATNASVTVHLGTPGA